MVQTTKVHVQEGLYREELYIVAKATCIFLKFLSGSMHEKKKKKKAFLNKMDSNLHFASFGCKKDKASAPLFACLWACSAGININWIEWGDSYHPNCRILYQTFNFLFFLAISILDLSFKSQILDGSSSEKWVFGGLCGSKKVRPTNPQGVPGFQPDYNLVENLLGPNPGYDSCVVVG